MAKKHKHYRQHNNKPQSAAQPAQRAPFPGTTEFEAHKQATIAEFAEKQYLAQGGRDIEAGIARCERLLKLHDSEMDGVLENPRENYRWKVGPSMVLRLQREIERLKQQRDELMEKCFEYVEEHAAQSEREMVHQRTMDIMNDIQVDVMRGAMEERAAAVPPAPPPQATSRVA